MRLIKREVDYIKTNKGNFTATLTQTKTLTMKKFTFFNCKYNRVVLIMQVFSRLFLGYFYIYKILT